MHVEVSVALNFVISYLYNKLPRRRVNMFAEVLEKGIKEKFSGHWYFDKPAKGSGYRSLRVNGENIDPVIVSSAYDCGLDVEEIKEYLPAELTLWIDPMEVSYKIGEKGPVKVLYSNRKEEVVVVDNTDCEIQVASRGFNPDAECFRPIDAIMSTSLSSLSLSPSSPTPSSTWSTSVSPSSAPHGSNNSVNNAKSFQQKQNQHVGNSRFTTATFAQTKFGSTKLKTQAKRPTRLSPTEFGHYLRQKNAAAHHQQVPNGFPSPQSPANNGFPSPQTANTGFYSPQTATHSGFYSPQTSNHTGFYSPQTAPQSGFQSPQSPTRPRSLSLSPRDAVSTNQSQRVLFSQLTQKSEQSRRQLMPADLLSPYAGSASMLSSFYRSPYHPAKANQHNQLSPDASSLGLDDLLSMNHSSTHSGYSLNDYHTAMSPDEPQTVNPRSIDMISENSVPFIPQISPQTMLYAEDSIRIPSPVQYDNSTGPNANNNPFHHLLLAS